MPREDDPTDADEKEADVYGDNAREDLSENDEISPEEGAFMEGYEKADDDEEKVDNDKYEKAFGDVEEGDDQPAEEEEELEDEF